MAIEEEEYLGELPDSPPIGVFTNREGMEGSGGPGGPGNGGGSGSYTPKPVPGQYESPPGTVSGVGYEVLVLAGPEYTTALALVASHQGLVATRGLAIDGGGSITLNRDSPLFNTEAPKQTNLILNPNFETQSGGTYSWGWQVSSRSPAATYGTTNTWLTTSGGSNRSLYVLTPGTGNVRLSTLEGTAGIKVSPHTNMTVTAQVNPKTVGRPTRLFVEFYDADGYYLSVESSVWAPLVNTEPNIVNHLSADGVVPSAARYASVGIEIAVPDVAGEEHRFDNFSFHQTPESTPFYDGRDKSDIIDKENLWEIYYNGVRVHEFLGMVRGSDLVNASESRTVQISGVGTVELLKRTRVLPSAWSMRNGKPWLVKPIKNLKEDFLQGTNSDNTAADAGYNARVWNKKVTMGVATDTSETGFGKIQIKNVSPKPTVEMIGTGPWDMRFGQSLPGDLSGFPNNLYFQALPYLLPLAQPMTDPEGGISYYPADFENVFEIYITDNDRCYVMVRSIAGADGSISHNLYVIFRSTDSTGKLLPNQNISGGQIPYNPTNHKWFQFRMSKPYDPLKPTKIADDPFSFDPAFPPKFTVETSQDGISWSQVPLAEKAITPANPVWWNNIDQVTFRVYSYFTGVPFAWAEEDDRPIGGVGQQGYTPGTDTRLQPVGQENLNPANTSFGRINDNGIPDTKSPVYDQMGYFLWKAQNAKSSRGALSKVSFDWTAGNFRTDAVTTAEVAYDSIGNVRKGPTATYFKDKDGVQVNPILINQTPVVTEVTVGTAAPEGAWKGSDGKLYYNKYTFKGDPTKEAWLVKVKVTEPVEGEQTFYTYFVQSCNLAKCEWSMKPGRSLQIYDTDPDLTNSNDMRWDPVKGFHKENSVFFHEGYSTISKQTTKSSESIVNYVIGHDTKGNYLVAKDDASIAKWGLREAWVSVDYSDPTQLSLDTAVSTILAIGVNEVETWSIQVPVLEGIRPFVDYEEGDWVSVAKHTGADPRLGSGTQATGYQPQYDAFRVMSISLSVGANGEETVELKLNSLVETQLEILNAKMNNANATSQVAVPSVPPSSSYAQISNTTLTTLGDVSVEGALAGSFLRLNSSGIWIAQPPDSTPPTIKNSYRSGALGRDITADPPDVTGLTRYTINHNLNTTSVVIKVLRSNGFDITGYYAWNNEVPAKLKRNGSSVTLDANRIRIDFDPTVWVPSSSDYASVIVLRGDSNETWI